MILVRHVMACLQLLYEGKFVLEEWLERYIL